jgi:hypothetical protein
MNLSSLPRYRRYSYLPDREQRIARRRWASQCLFIGVRIKPNRFGRAIPSEGLKGAIGSLDGVPEGHTTVPLMRGARGRQARGVTKLSEPPSNENKKNDKCKT